MECGEFTVPEHKAALEVNSTWKAPGNFRNLDATTTFNPSKFKNNIQQHGE